MTAVEGTLSVRELNRATLARQMLLERTAVPVVEAVERLGGLQAQEPRPPFIGLWTRLDGFRSEDLADALGDGDLVRATLMRATLHIASARDYALLRPALAPVMTTAMGALRGRDEGLDLDALVPAARELVAERPRTFAELRELLTQAFPDVDERALGYATRLHLPLVMVPTDDRWAYPSVASFGLFGPALSSDDGVPALVRRYLGAFGPAAAADLQSWSGLKGMKAVLGALRDELVVFRDERGRELFDLPGAPRPDPDVPAPVRFLPEFDSLVLAHADRTRVVPDEHRGEIVTKNLRVRATVLWDGFAAGTWTVKRSKRTATLVVTPFDTLRRDAKKAIVAEGEALLGFAEEDAGDTKVVIETA